jgi:hypothetical protein
VLVQRNCKRSAESKWNDNTGSGDGGRETRIAADNRSVDLKPNKEEEETQPNVGNKREKGY